MNSAPRHRPSANAPPPPAEWQGRGCAHRTAARGGHISVVTDVTDLTEAEDRASRRAEELAVMLGSIRHGITLWSRERTVVASNAMASELLGHPPGVLVPGRTMQEAIDHMVARGELGDGDAAAARAETWPGATGEMSTSAN